MKFVFRVIHRFSPWFRMMRHEKRSSLRRINMQGYLLLGWLKGTSAGTHEKEILRIIVTTVQGYLVHENYGNS
jgi:hypothetical protein